MHCHWGTKNRAEFLIFFLKTVLSVLAAVFVGVLQECTIYLSTFLPKQKHFLCAFLPKQKYFAKYVELFSPDGV
jgi:hypothetical protein